MFALPPGKNTVQGAILEADTGALPDTKLAGAWNLDSSASKAYSLSGPECQGLCDSSTDGLRQPGGRLASRFCPLHLAQPGPRPASRRKALSLYTLTEQPPPPAPLHGPCGPAALPPLQHCLDLLTGFWFHSPPGHWTGHSEAKLDFTSMSQWVNLSNMRTPWPFYLGLYGYSWSSKHSLWKTSAKATLGHVKVFIPSKVAYYEPTLSCQH